MKNLYKRGDIFRCNEGGHERFENSVSVYHVLRDRRCYPEGCIAFRWRCRHPRGEKGCPRGFQHVGRLCLSCAQFYDEKIVRYPRLLLSQSEYQTFLKDLGAFEDWLARISGREVSLWGTVHSVKPWFKEAIHAHGSQVGFLGFLLHLAEAYLDRVFWEDRCYVLISRRLQARYRFRRGDRVSLRAKVRVDAGRLVLHRVREVEIEAKTEGEYWTEGKALLARRLGSFFAGQPERCLSCEQGTLLDVVEGLGEGERKSRRLYCLQGVADPRFCSLHGEAELASIQSIGEEGEQGERSP